MATDGRQLLHNHPPNGDFAVAAMEADVLFSPLLVESVVPGWTLTVRDMLTVRHGRSHAQTG